jgi:hypothetical protein
MMHQCRQRGKKKNDSVISSKSQVSLSTLTGSSRNIANGIESIVCLNTSQTQTQCPISEAWLRRSSNHPNGINSSGNYQEILRSSLLSLGIPRWQLPFWVDATASRRRPKTFLARSNCYYTGPRLRPKADMRTPFCVNSPPLNSRSMMWARLIIVRRLLILKRLLEPMCGGAKVHQHLGHEQSDFMED